MKQIFQIATVGLLRVKLTKEEYSIAVLDIYRQTVIDKTNYVSLEIYAETTPGATYCIDTHHRSTILSMRCHVSWRECK